MKNALNTPEKHLDLGQILADATLFHSQPCIYYLINEQDQVIFVGQTINLYAQLLNHKLTGKNFARFSYFPCRQEELNKLEQEAIEQFKPVHNQPPAIRSTSSFLSKQLICLKHNITPVAFEYLRKSFGLESAHSYGNMKYYKPEDVDAWLKRFKGLVIRGRHVLQASPSYLAVGVSPRTNQIQLFKTR
ncbi:GIY-YIG nuclease family protein [Spirosoma sp. KNUC1025]|uniref:GIY-YIG nuclease family protein n=1 Tax=Spirosoma sp. KNUC1025 TaxID=2894082 RepID=UPI00386710EC|nr:GIY-YIG nuclease family protein [Spirosoma sp. KNUC1025]